ncbi:MAG: DMT family transporter, partial [Pseudomonadota bacterium]
FNLSRCVSPEIRAQRPCTMVAPTPSYATTPDVERQGIFFALLGFFSFAVHDAIIKLLGAQFSVVQVIFCVNAVAAIPVIGIVVSRLGAGALIPVNPGWIAARCCAILGTVSCAFYAFSVLPLAEAYVLFFAAPLFVTLLSVPFLGETVGWRRMAAILVGFLGVLVVLRPGAADFSWGHLAGLGCALCGASAAPIVRKIGQPERLGVLLAYPIACNTLVMGSVMPWVAEPVGLSDLGFICLAALFFVSGQAMIVRAFRRARAAMVAPVQYSQILWATLLGWLFFAEIPDGWTGLGACIVIGSGLFIVFRENKRDATSARPGSRAIRTEAAPSPEAARKAELR